MLGWYRRKLAWWAHTAPPAITVNVRGLRISVCADIQAYGLRPQIRANMGGGKTFTWLNLEVWTVAKC